MQTLPPSDFRLAVYDIALGAAATIPFHGANFLYVWSGTATVTADGAETALGTDDGTMLDGPATVTGDGIAWLYEFAPRTQPTIENDAFSLVMARNLPTTFEGPRMFRADRVESNPGAQTPLHGHRGPGIRRLLMGRLHAFIGDDVDRIDAGDAWFETGKDWVIGKNIADGVSAFVRVMMLPVELKGGTSSFVPATPVEGAKPRSVSYRLFGERDLP